MKAITIIDQDTNEEFLLEDIGDNSIIREFEGFEMAEVRSSIEYLSGEQSAHFINSKFGKRSLSISGDFIGGDVFATRRELLSVLRQLGKLKLIKITTYDDLLLQFEASIEKLVMPYNHQIHSFLLEMIAPDWRFYSQTEKTTTIDRNDDETIINAGNERTCPVLRINGPITTAEIVNLTTNQTVNLTHTLLEGEYIDIDCFNQTIVDNEGTDLYNAFDDSPEFPCLDPGTNSVQFSSTGDGATTQLDVVFRDAYNGI